MKYLIFVLLSIISFIISSAVHELGHILIGLKEGFKFNLLVVGPFGLKRDENDKIVFYIEKDVSLWGGLGQTIPTNNNKNNYKKFGRILLAGPIASLILGTISLLIGINTKHIFFILLGCISLSMGIVCLIPMRNGAFYTDGGRWLRMKSNKTRNVEMAIWNLGQNTIIQGNYSKLNFDEIMVLINDEDIRTKYLGHHYAYCYYKDNNNNDGMEKEKIELEKLKGKVPKQMVSMYDVD